MVPKGGCPRLPELVVVPEGACPRLPGLLELARLSMRPDSSPGPGPCLAREAAHTCVLLTGASRLARSPRPFPSRPFLTFFPTFGPKYSPPHHLFIVYPQLVVHAKPWARLQAEE